jgi:hypothetical protein
MAINDIDLMVNGSVNSNSFINAFSIVILLICDGNLYIFPVKSLLFISQLSLPCISIVLNLPHCRVQYKLTILLLAYLLYLLLIYILEL